MKKFKDFILSFILPRKMYVHHSMKFIYSFLIFFVMAMILLLPVNLTTKRFMRKTFTMVDFDKTNYQVVSENVNIPEYQLVETDNKMFFFDVLASSGTNVDNFKGVYQINLQDQTTNKLLEVTIVFDEGCDMFKEDGASISIDHELFDINGYVNQPHEDNKTYILYIFTKKSFYYLYDLGKIYNQNNQTYIDTEIMAKRGYELDNEGQFVYYLPKDESELVKNNFGEYDTTYWTVQSSVEGEVTINNETITAKRRLIGQYQYYLPKDESELKILDNGKYDTSLWTYNTDVKKGDQRSLNGVIFTASPRYEVYLRYAIFNGEYLYTYLDTDLVNAKEHAANFATNPDVKEVLLSYLDMMVDSDTNAQKSMYGIFVFLMNVIFPLIWVFITWLVSRKFIMNRFGEYYAICAISYILSSLVGCILAFFIRFDRLLLIILAIQLIFYIVVTFRINTDPALLEPKDDEKNQNSDDDKKQIEKPELNFKKIKSDDTYTVE